MKPENKRARRYHWYSGDVSSFVNEPHTAVCGDNQGPILNLVAEAAKPTRSGILDITREDPARMLKELPKLLVPQQK